MNRTSIRIIIRTVLVFFLLSPAAGYGQVKDNLTYSTMPDSTAIMQQIEQANRLKDARPDSALTMLSHALDQSKKAHFDKGVRNALVNLMQLHYKNNRYDVSLKTAKALQAASDSIKNKDAFFYSWYGTALAYQRTDRLDSAFEAYSKALYFLPDTSVIRISIYSNMGELLHRMGKWEKAMTYFKRGIEWQKIHNVNTKDALSGLTSLYINMGSVYSIMNAFETSDSCFQKALQLAQQRQSIEDIYSIKRLQAFMYNNRKMPREALVAINEAKHLLQQHPIPKRLSVSPQLDMAAGEAYLQLGKYTLAEASLKKAFTATDSFDVNERSIISHKLSRLYDSTRDYKKAYQFVQYAYDLSEKIKNKEVQVRFNESETRYQNVLKDQELALKSAQLSTYQRNMARKNLLIVSISLGLIIVLILLRSARRNYQRRQQIHQQEKEIERLKAVMSGEEKERVRLARELHDGIGSMLAAIKMNVGTIRNINTDPGVGYQLDTIVTMLQETSAEVRTTAHNLVPDVLSKYDLREAVLQYIQKMQDNHALPITLHMPGSPDTLEKPVELVVYRMVQELVQNVIKHASATHVDIQLLTLDHNLSLTVEDNGKGIATENGAASGFGLDNLRYRVHALHGEIDIDSIPGKGTTVRITFDPDKLKQKT